MSEPARVQAARELCGYRSQPFRDSSYGKLYGYGGSPWNGMFIDRLLKEDGTLEVSFVSTVTALSFYVRKNRLRLKPKVGDIVFFNHSLKPFEQPHVGLVVSIDGWGTERHVQTVEGETSTGQPRGSQEPDGVFERHRYETDIIGFVTPKKARVIPPQEPETVEPMRLSFFTSNPKTKARTAELIQRALFYLTAQTNFAKGKYDAHTKSAIAKWNRERGVVHTNGDPDGKTLKALGEASGLFKFDG